MKNLQLSLKRQWFEMTKAGIKTEDYRDITPYWCKRLLLYCGESLLENTKVKLQSYLDEKDIVEMCNDLNSCIDEEELEYQIDNWYLSFKEFDCNIMTKGYPKSTDSDRILKLEHKGIEIGYGKEEWGAEPNKFYFIIKHGKRL